MTLAILFASFPSVHRISFRIREASHFQTKTNIYLRIVRESMLSVIVLFSLITALKWRVVSGPLGLSRSTLITCIKPREIVGYGAVLKRATYSVPQNVGFHRREIWAKEYEQFKSMDALPEDGYSKRYYHLSFISLIKSRAIHNTYK